jgi:DNA-binding XRE family transcriptional regulator
VNDSKTGEQIRYVSLDASVYGAEDGAVAFLDMPEGYISPPTIERLWYLGDVPSMFSLALRAMAETHDGRDLQQALAEHLDVKQQSISKWENALFAPRLTSSQWAKLIKLVIAAPERAARS